MRISILLAITSRLRLLTGSRPIPALTCQEPASRFSADRVAARNRRLQGTARRTVLQVRASGVTPQAPISSATRRDRAISSSGFVAARSCSDGYTALAASRQKKEIAAVAAAMKRESGFHTPEPGLPSSHSYGYGACPGRLSPAPAFSRICPAPVRRIASLGILVQYAG
jgi:hypothetical protein